MTSKLKCPFCLQELKKDESGAYYCTTKWYDLWGVIISRCAAEHFTQTTQDMLNTAKILATTEKDLEIARKALEDIKSDYELYSEQGCRMEPNETDMYNYARKALETIGKHNE